MTNNPNELFPDDPVKRCGYFFLSLPTCHPFTDCCGRHDLAYGIPQKTIVGAVRNLFTGETISGQNTISSSGSRTRSEVDAEFMACMFATITKENLDPKVYKKQARWMYWIVRKIGWAFWPKGEQ